MKPLYKSRKWKRLRAEVLASDKYECQDCKARGRYTRADTVHHIKRVKQYPKLAMSKIYIDEQGNVKRNLISLCRDCHEKAHGFRCKDNVEFLTEEKW